MPARYLAAVRQGADEDSDAAAAPAYTFDGFTIDVSQKIALTPIAPRKHHHPAGQPGREAGQAQPA
jgi:hypothetical protein